MLISLAILASGINIYFFQISEIVILDIRNKYFFGNSE